MIKDKNNEGQTSNKKSDLTPQWERRVKTFKFIYSCLIKDDDAQVAKAEAFNKYEFDSEQLSLIEYFLDNKQEIINKLEHEMPSKWTFDRLNYVDQAILLDACAETKTWLTDKAIIIDQSVITAKKYSDKDSYKFINAILEKVL
ncbi:transcription antitermination factor NusB [Ureaplasma ceti]|uniref:Transcription antitermination factor NusB n=1 Tax=Ureaplasma ceti TaxID=3119530 RepID=A0ABP9UA55_9BACT